MIKYDKIWKLFFVGWLVGWSIQWYSLGSNAVLAPLTFIVRTKTSFKISFCMCVFSITM